ncbi:MAG: DUF4279 domain-containing protein [Polyangiales bacterium]
MSDPSVSCEISASLNLCGGAFDFEHCSKAIGVAATSTWTRKIEHDAIPEASWSIGFDKRPYDCVDVAVSAVLEQVEGLEERVRAYAKAQALEVSLSCDVFIYKQRPLYSLSPATMKRLSELHAEFRLDIFDYSPCDCEATE